MEYQLMSEKIRIGLIGLGKLGSIHAKHISQSEFAELFAVCDINEDALVNARAEYNTRTFTELEAFLAQPLDGVVIASNTALHLQHVQAVAKAGIAIFTEKPVGLTLEETDSVLQEVVNAKVKFQIGFQRRWDSRYLKAKELIKSGVIGRPVLFKAYGRDPDASNPANWGLDKNGGLFLNAAIHDYDAARFIFDKEVTKVSAHGGALVHTGLSEVGDVDTSATTLFLGEESMAITEWSRYAAYGYDVGAEIIGTEGIIRIGRDYTETVTVLRKNSEAPAVYAVFSDAYKSEIDGFISAIKNDLPTTPGIEDARIALDIALQARDSFNKDGLGVTTRSLVPLTETP